MNRCFICLGKIGDVLSIAPILQNEWRQTGQKQNLFVSKDYAGVAERLPGVNPVVFDGHFSELSRAIKEAKRKFSKVTTLQVYGKDIAFQKWTPSFQLDQWMRGWAVNEFLNWPLETISVESPAMDRAKYVLFADVSQSSPFDHREELAELIKTSLPKHVLLRLSEINLGSICDFVPLYMGADAIVSVETAHLHLTRACSTPVIAFVTDKPSRWHGSAWHPRYRLHCRYGDFQNRKAEISHALKNSTSPTSRPIGTARPHGYNPSIIKHVGAVFTSYRWHNRNDWRTTLNLIDSSGGDHEIAFPEQFKEASIEDGRLFTFQGKLMLSYVVSVAMNGLFRCAYGYGELVNDGGWKIARHYQPKFGGNDFSGLQKNWVPFEHKGRLHFIYASSPDQIVIQVSGDQVESVFKSKGYEWPYGTIRGGCIIPHNGRLLRFFHSHTTTGDRELWIYRVGAAVMDPEPPFETIQVCSHPVLAGNEKWTQCKHWKANVVFPAGVVESDGGWNLACGSNDCESILVNLKPKDLNL